MITAENERRRPKNMTTAVTQKKTHTHSDGMQAKVFVSRLVGRQCLLRRRRRRRFYSWRLLAATMTARLRKRASRILAK